MALRVPALLALFVLGASAEGPKPVEATAKSVDGLSIAYDTRGSAALSLIKTPEGQKTCVPDVTLVFIHGWCGDRSFWKEQLDVFGAHHRVVSLDLGGHGASGRDRAEWTVDSMADDVEAALKAADVKRAILVGHSMGGPIALLVAKRMPDRVAAVVGVDTLHNVEFKWPEEQTKQILAAMEADFETLTRQFMAGMLPPNTDAALTKSLIDKVLAADRKMAVGVMRSMTAFDAKTALAGAKVPVRCVNAAARPPFAMETAVDVNRKYGDFDAVLIEGVGHFPMLEKPKEFNEKLAESLKLDALPAKRE